MLFALLLLEDVGGLADFFDVVVEDVADVDDDSDWLVLLRKESEAVDDDNGVVIG